jgi:predicted HicB family RNase H-like nuclease
MRNVSIALDPDAARRLRLAAATADMSVSAYVAGLVASAPPAFAETGQAPYRAEGGTGPAPASTKITLSLPTELVARLRVDAARAGKSMSRHLAELVGASAPDVTQSRLAAQQRELEHGLAQARECSRVEEDVSRFGGQAVGMTQLEALRMFLSGPRLNLTVNGKAPSRDEIYE